MSVPFQSLHFLLRFTECQCSCQQSVFLSLSLCTGLQYRQIAKTLPHLKLKVEGNFLFSVSYVNPVCFSPLPLQMSVFAGQIKGR